MLFCAEDNEHMVLVEAACADDVRRFALAKNFNIDFLIIREATDLDKFEAKSRGALVKNILGN